MSEETNVQTVATEAPAAPAAPVAAPAAAPVQADRPQGDRPHGDRPQGERRPYRPREDRGDRDDRRGGGRGGRRPRRKICAFCVDKMELIDYKDTARLRRYLNERGRIMPRRTSGVCAKHQRLLATAIKRSRQAALIPYILE